MLQFIYKYSVNSFGFQGIIFEVFIIQVFSSFKIQSLAIDRCFSRFHRLFNCG